MNTELNQKIVDEICDYAEKYQIKVYYIIFLDIYFTNLILIIAGSTQGIFNAISSS